MKKIIYRVMYKKNMLYNILKTYPYNIIIKINQRERNDE